MSIQVFTGAVGSGKTYHIVNDVIIPHLRDPLTSARKIIHNVRLKPRVIETEYFFPFSLNEKVFQFTNDQIMSAVSDMEKIQGALIIIDEFQLIWPSSKGMTNPKHLEFFTTHRHYMIDIIIGTQDLDNIVKQVRNLVEVENHFKALKHIGMTSGYVVEAYFNKSRKPDLRLNRRYDPEKFKFYQSHATSALQAGHKEVRVRPATHALKYYVAMLVIAGILIIGGFYRIYSRTQNIDQRLAPPKSELNGLGDIHSSAVSAKPVKVDEKKTTKADHPEIRALTYNGEMVTLSKSFRVSGLTRIGIKRIYTLSEISDHMEGIDGKSYRVVKFEDAWQVGELVQIGNTPIYYNPRKFESSHVRQQESNLNDHPVSGDVSPPRSSVQVSPGVSPVEQVPYSFVPDLPPVFANHDVQ